jgi:hypothetical protein
MRGSHLVVARSGLLVVLAACGSVQNQNPADAGPIDGAAIDAWAMNCAPAMDITKVEVSDPSYGNACIHGQWYLQAFNGTTSPSAPDQPDHRVVVRPVSIPIGTDTEDTMSTFAVHVTGSGQENSGTTFSYAQLNASLNAPAPAQVGSVDASAYTGIQFYAIVNTAATGARLTVANLYTDPIGGMCTTTAGQPNSCFDHPGIQLAVHGTWSQYQVPFASLTQLGFGNHSPTGAAFPKNAITLMKWDIGIPSSGATQPWELWVDDLQFY